MNTQALSPKITAMRGSLQSWLKLRRTMDAVAGGKAIRALLPAPGVKVVPADTASLRDERFLDEQRLATSLYNLLAEVIDPQSLPSPDVKRNTDAAVHLAEIVIAGRLPAEAPAAQAQGFIWMWPVLLVGGVVLLLSSVVRSFADVAKEKERIRCIQAGACTDTGFWVKAAAVGVIGWLAWDKLGLKDKLKGRGAARRR